MPLEDVVPIPPFLSTDNPILLRNLPANSLHGFRVNPTKHIIPHHNHRQGSLLQLLGHRMTPIQDLFENGGIAAEMGLGVG